MAVETIGEAYMLGWRIDARCGWGRREAMKSVRGCLGKAELDLHTLVWTRGAAFPISQLDGRLKMSTVRLTAGSANLRSAEGASREEDCGGAERLVCGQSNVGRSKCLRCRI
jgi:hypothetical protein